MAESCKLLATFVIIILFLSEKTSGRSTTAALDVSASVAAAARAVTAMQEQFAEKLEKESGIAAADGGGDAASLYLKLHSRDFLPDGYSRRKGGSGESYRDLTLDRLARDAARVVGIVSRVALATQGLHGADLLPSEATMEVLTAAGDGTFLHAPIVSGTSHGSGEYFSRVGFGRPAKELFVVIDTGSDVSWIQCDPCSTCYQQTDPVFDPSSSSSYSPLRCDSQPCRSLDVSACRQSTCLYQVSYGDGSYTVGNFATETISFGGGSSVAGVAIGCGHDNEGLFVGAAGLLALGGGSLSFPSQISAKSFSYCLVDRDSPSSSDLEFGDAAASVGAESVTAPLVRNDKLNTFYYVGMTGISVGGQLLSIPPSSFSVDDSGSGGIIVDSGTAVTRLQSDAYAALRDAFSGGTTGLRRAANVALFDTCYDLSSMSSVDVPTVSFHFPSGTELKLPAKNYLIPVDSNGTFCLAFAPTSSALSIIGNVQQQGTRVAFDVDNSVVVFTPNKC